MIHLTESFGGAFLLPAFYHEEGSIPCHDVPTTTLCSASGCLCCYHWWDANLPKLSKDVIQSLLSTKCLAICAIARALDSFASVEPPLRLALFVTWRSSLEVVLPHFPPSIDHPFTAAMDRMAESTLLPAGVLEGRFIRTILDAITQAEIVIADVFHGPLPGQTLLVDNTDFCHTISLTVVGALCLALRMLDPVPRAMTIVLTGHFPVLLAFFPATARSLAALEAVRNSFSFECFEDIRHQQRLV